MLWQYSDRDPLAGALNSGGVGKNCDPRPVSGLASMTGGVSSTI